MTLPVFENYRPAHLSYSTLNSYRSCGMQMKLQKILKKEQRPGLAGIAGNAVHTATEWWDERSMGVSALEHDWLGPEQAFRTAWNLEIEKRREQSPSFRVEDYVATGRAAAKYGGKRTVDFWMDEGPAMVQRWIDWRESAGWQVWETPEGRPAVETELRIVLPGDTPILMFLDRIMVTPSGEIVVVDIKGLSVDTPLATPTGWTTMGAVQVGDKVFGTDGHPCRVTAKSQVKYMGCYRVHFDDGTSIVCDEEHLWETTAGDSGRTTTAVRSIGDIDTSETHRIRMPEALDLPEAELPLDPYVLGAWLGDGNRSRGVITKPDAELFDEIVRRGYAVGVPQIDKRSKCPTRTILGLQGVLREMDQLGNKHVPEAYLRGSIQQRLDLLRGLMDTDGTFNKARRDVRFYSTDKATAFAVEELALSLGERARVHEVQRTGFGKTVTCYDVTWKPQRHNPFLLPRKADQVDMSYKSVRSQQRIIKHIEPMPSVPTQCIAVDSPDRMYLAGAQMVPTHNTGRLPETPEQLGLYAVGIELTWGSAYRPDWGYFWDATKGTHGEPKDLRRYTAEYFGEMYAEAVAGINAGCFLAKPANSCANWCGVSAYCPAVGGSLAFQQSS